MNSDERHSPTAEPGRDRRPIEGDVAALGGVTLAVAGWIFLHYSPGHGVEWAVAVGSIFSTLVIFVFLIVREQTTALKSVAHGVQALGIVLVVGGLWTPRSTEIFASARADYALAFTGVALQCIGFGVAGRFTDFPRWGRVGLLVIGVVAGGVAYQTLPPALHRFRDVLVRVDEPAEWQNVSVADWNWIRECAERERTGPFAEYLELPVDEPLGEEVTISDLSRALALAGWSLLDRDPMLARRYWLVAEEIERSTAEHAPTPSDGVGDSP